MSFFLETLKHFYPIWLQACDSHILYFIPDHWRFHDERDSLYVTWLWGVTFVALILVSFVGITVFAKRLVDITRNHL